MGPSVIHQYPNILTKLFLKLLNNWINITKFSFVHEGADLGIKVQVASSVEVEDLVEAEPAPVEEELRDPGVGDDPVAVVGHVDHAAAPRDAAQARRRELGHSFAEQRVFSSANIQYYFIFAASKLILLSKYILF